MTALLTNRLKLQVLAPEDVEDIYDYARDPLVAQNTAWSAHQGIEDTKDFVAYIISKKNSTPGQIHHVWGIRENGFNKVIGTISFQQDNDFEGHIDYALARSHWGQGLTTEAVTAIIDWVFKEIPTIRQINSGCLSRNIGSVKVLEKTGFSITNQYVSRRGGKFKNKMLETTLFRLRRTDWKKI